MRSYYCDVLPTWRVLHTPRNHNARTTPIHQRSRIHVTQKTSRPSLQQAKLTIVPKNSKLHPIGSKGNIHVRYRPKENIEDQHTTHRIHDNHVAILPHHRELPPTRRVHQTLQITLTHVHKTLHRQQ